MRLEDIDLTQTILRTERLTLRPFKESDLDDLYEYAKVEGVGEAAGWRHHADTGETESVLKMFIKGRRTLAVTYNTSGKAIGSVGIEQSGDIFHGIFADKNINELGYVLSKDYWGRGLMTEAARAMIAHMFGAMALDAVTCGHFLGNERSRRVIEKCNFTYYARGQYRTSTGEAHQCEYYYLTRADFEKLRGKIF